VAVQAAEMGERTTMTSAITAAGLRKSFGGKTVLDGIDLEVGAGTTFSLLGPNGAGKTTIVQIMSTLVHADGGEVRVAGHDVARDPAAVRAAIGVTGQFSAVDNLLTGEENLRLMANLAHLGRRDGRRRVRRLLERFDLTEAAGRMVMTYSGGMRRRLDLAASLVTRPPVLFLDEPTTGLDPTSRQRMWDVIRELVADGTTLLLTTQYLDEADALADTISVIDHGRVIAQGTARELKARIGGDQIEVTLTTPNPDAVAALEPLVKGRVQVVDDGRRLVAPVEPGGGIVTTIVRALDDAGVSVDDIEFHHPSLDDVFFTLTGHPAEPEPIDDPDERDELQEVPA